MIIFDVSKLQIERKALKHIVSRKGNPHAHPNFAWTSFIQMFMEMHFIESVTEVYTVSELASPYNIHLDVKNVLKSAAYPN